VRFEVLTAVKIQIEVFTAQKTSPLMALHCAPVYFMGAY